MDIFVYGTLRSAALMAAVAGAGPLRSVPASVSAFEVCPLAGNVVPFIRPASARTAFGLVWQDLTADQVRRLDLYEGAFGYRLETVVVQTDEGPREAQFYLPPEGSLAGEGSWSLERWETDHLAPALLAAAEIFALDPAPDHAQLRAMWPMIEARAWSRHRAKAGPATARYAAGVDDFGLITARPQHGDFFRFQSLDIQHRRFDGQRSDILTREGFFGVDAAIVLPYDPVRDRVLLVEQARLGPRLRNDPNPWMLEPVAGIVDARETPQDAALREAREEAGIAITRLEPAAGFYVSPGASTDYFYTFVGLCDLPRSEPYMGGLPEEGEDLRVHPLSFDAAMALADSGEVATGPALFLLYWLLRHRDRLRAAL
ncbi:MAG: NUDIX domain-containing protein [Yoonia sp.]|uniref:NUDIX domain-containing protein n=1 Tax=Yoonia sp. TaxID=2212373 RepID=UPI00273D5AC8|nr:NUDIX domain-containing protein [Yoonia sp.]MDP5084307.1 NUDIX domain-containing protein [Yoonia sp.]